jgi:hypothetical protein
MRLKGFVLVPVILIALVVILGFFIYKNYQQEAGNGEVNRASPPATLATLAPKFTPLPDSTTEWKTYKNTFYKYSFKYPNNAQLNASNYGPGFTTLDSENKELTISPIPPNGEYIYVSALGYFAPLIKLSDWEKIDANINGQQIEAYRNKKVNTSINKILYRFKNQEREVQIDFMLNYTSDNSEFIDTFKQIISTFKFTQ